MKFMLKENVDEENALGIQTVYHSLISSYFGLIDNLAGIIYTLKDMGETDNIELFQNQIETLNGMVDSVNELCDETKEDIKKIEIDESKKKKNSAVQFLGGGSPLENMKMFNHLNDVNYAAFSPDGSNDISGEVSAASVADTGAVSDGGTMAMGEAFHLRSEK